mmetsp:Transcript_66141/g.146952  ORF Transcript_66141/g.146952 Transcript_66141/m.146952 type:complete len:358 (+) Transcript_66141:59-1132(+)
MKLSDVLTSFSGAGHQYGSRLTSFQGFGGYGDMGGYADDASAGGGEWWQDESSNWHFGGPAEYWWRDEHHQWHKGGDSQLWRQDEGGTWHEVQEDSPKASEDELMMGAGGQEDMGEPQEDIKDLDALNDALKEDMPPMDPSFTPSIENIITKTGPTELGRNVAELSRALGQLKDDVNSNLSQDRIAAMTSEDVPNMVTPVADSLKEVIRSAKSMQDRLTAISDAAYGIVGTAAEDAERRLNGSPPEEAEEEFGAEEPGPDWGEGGYGYGEGYHDHGGYDYGGYDAYGPEEHAGHGYGAPQMQGSLQASAFAARKGTAALQPGVKGAGLPLPSLTAWQVLPPMQRRLVAGRRQLKNFF